MPSYLKNLSESNREIYESAHSVVLSMLVRDFQSGQETSTSLDLNDNEEEMLWTGFTHRLVPFYAQCLVEDTMPKRPQFRHIQVLRAHGVILKFDE